jgi:hypothetical protein
MTTFNAIKTLLNGWPIKEEEIIYVEEEGE